MSTDPGTPSARASEPGGSAPEAGALQRPSAETLHAAELAELAGGHGAGHDRLGACPEDGDDARKDEEDADTGQDRPCTDGALRGLEGQERLHRRNSSLLVSHKISACHV